MSDSERGQRRVREKRKKLTKKRRKGGGIEN